MILFGGADISIRYDSEREVYLASVHIGNYSKLAVDPDPVRALGLAMLLQAGYTEEKLQAELQKKENRIV